MKRRQFLSASAATTTLAFPALVRAQNQRFAGITLRVNGFGGDWDQIMQEHIAQPLERKIGLKVTFTPGSGVAALSKTLASLGDDPAFDILIQDSPGIPELIKAQAVKSVTTSDVKGMSKVLPGIREFGDVGVPICLSSAILAYNTNRVKTAPKSYADLARPEFKERIALVNLENNIGLFQLLAMAEANGGSVDNMGPGFAALARLKPNVATITSSTINVLQLLEQEEVWATAFWDGRVYSLQKKGKPIAVVEPAEGSYSQVSYFCPIKGSKHPEAVQAFLEESLAGAYAAAVSTFFGYVPATDVKLPADVVSKMFKPKNRRKADWVKIAANRGAWMDRFNREFR